MSDRSLVTLPIYSIYLSISRFDHPFKFYISKNGTKNENSCLNHHTGYRIHKRLMTITALLLQICGVFAFSESVSCV